ncbi:LysR family transcriptional regulator [uncultured Caulobacter sp.]|uniref:LysR family transcriptional regulator n=1 Tax=uncultured Caulobacter sp. TaxID=158749 RepID=UPI00262E80DC|nr:LysR family transcriptional regulator [uncultured Caulobacter sp.]
MHALNWNDLRVFLAVARSAGLITAGRRLGLDPTTVGRRVGALETSLGVKLIERTTRGSILTSSGEALLEHAERVEAEMMAVSARLGASGPPLSGTVRLSTPEAFGANLVAPAASLFHARFPELQLELVPETRNVDMMRREADIAISLSRPTRGRVISEKLADYTLGLYASKDYLAIHSAPAQLAELSERPLVWYIDDLIDVPELRYLDQVAAGAGTVFRSNSIAAQHAAVASGLGLGMLHRFAAEPDPRLRRVLPEVVSLQRSYWLSVHENLAHLPRIRAVRDFLLALVRSRADDL